MAAVNKLPRFVQDPLNEPLMGSNTSYVVTCIALEVDVKLSVSRGSLLALI